MAAKCPATRCTYTHDPRAKKKWRESKQPIPSLVEQRRLMRSFNPRNDPLVAHVQAKTAHLPFDPFASLISAQLSKKPRKHHALSVPPPSADLYRRLLGAQLQQEERAVLQCLRYVEAQHFFQSNK
jgi:hypothetical protein